MKLRTPLICTAAWVAFAGLMPVADGQGTKADYERAAGLEKLTKGKVFRDRVRPHWLPGGDKFWYRVETAPGKTEYVLVDAATGEKMPAPEDVRSAGSPPAAGWPFEHAPKASRRTGPETEIVFANRTETDVELFWLDPDGRRKSYGKLAPGRRRTQHTYAGHVWLAVAADGTELVVFVADEDPLVAEITGKCTSDPPGREKDRSRRRPRDVSPDGKWRATVRDHNVWLRDAASGEEFPLSDDGSAEQFYQDRFYWSPDSEKLVALRTTAGDDRKVYYVEAAPEDQLQPELQSYDYLKPGDRIRQDRPQLFDVASRKHVPVDDALFSNPWSINDVRWAPDSSRFTFVYNQRGHQVLRIVAVDATTGDARAIVDERSKTFIDYAGKQYAHYLDQSGEIIWMSERDGWNHLYLYDSASGKVKNQITSGPWVVRGVEFVDPDARQIWFRAGGIRPEQDPYYVHYCRITFDGSGLVVLTVGDGDHSVEFSPDRRFLIDRWSRVDLPPVTELRRAQDGSLVAELERADWSRLLAAGWQPPERFKAKGRDGTTDIYGVIYRPTTFDPAKKYPVIEEIYAGPHGAFVPKGFRSYYKAQSLAELGFVVVKIDGMGTSQRSKAFHDVCWKNLGDAGFADRILWIKAAAESRPCMDLSRVGIYGGSAGGQSAMRALVAHGDFYKVAVADCGCHDNRMDKIWWNELWMGWPVGPHYEEQSNVTQAHNLQGKLLLVVGAEDRNVDPASTMQVVDALVKADKDFDLLVIPSAGHGAAETPYGNRRRQDFFVRNLLGVEPRR